MDAEDALRSRPVLPWGEARHAQKAQQRMLESCCFAREIMRARWEEWEWEDGFIKLHTQ